MTGEPKFFRGIKINQCKEGVHVHQTKYTKEVLKKLKLDDFKIIHTHMHPTCNMSKKENITKSDLREKHLTFVKRIFRYMKGTTTLGLLYKKSLDYKLVGFCGTDNAGDKIERKSTSESCQFIGENLISWASKRQATIALSTKA
ncbi:uncharacterized mitochondrial protein AtMg00810-like [Lathyrus oleraceus]|uniref:uncharacterized mitochondrial protein AtMg00810-like n=1 Tax=Pisum sativum TaxID=3888 RepID=UPI0021D0BC10|nr:uncharacterized mitochondrial protein AtMg00810-like [Pisum sativum]XP_050909056.1 uncharacterized mitochondrial protein AtMg00810-like [Pisum sativum]